MTPEFLPLTTAALPDALALVSAFYAEEELDFQESRARRALEHLLDHPECGVFQFIELDGARVGYFALTLGFSLEFAGPFALLDEFYVDAGHRGRGVGAAALGHIERTAAGLGVAALRLEVERANTRVGAFYQRSGFRPHGRDLMTKWLG
jgi:GNAT superfamily N-acetyltransferase